MTNPGVMAELDDIAGLLGSASDKDRLKSIRNRIAALVEAARPFDIETLPTMHDDQLVTPARSLPASAYRKLSEALREIGR